MSHGQWSINNELLSVVVGFPSHFLHPFHPALVNGRVDPPKIVGSHCPAEFLLWAADTSLPMPL
jgi:hypothetical protein